jgi:hypothetical protein
MYAGTPGGSNSRRSRSLSAGKVLATGGVESKANIDIAAMMMAR